MRIFAALALPNEPRAALEAEINRLRRKYSDCGRWSQSKNLHLTMAFLGEAHPTLQRKSRQPWQKCRRQRCAGVFQVWAFSAVSRFCGQAWRRRTASMRWLSRFVRVLTIWDSTMTGNPFAHISRSLANGRGQPQALSSPLANYSFAVSPVCVRLYASERDASGRICYRVLSSY